MNSSNPVDFSQVDMTNPQDWVMTNVLIKEYDNIPEPTIRHFIRNCKKNGLAPAVKRFGKYNLTNRKGFGFYVVNV